MAEPVIYDWMMEASRVFFNTMAERGPFEYMTDEEQEGVESELMRIIAAAFAEHDVERMLIQLGEDTGGYPVTVRVRPKRCQDATNELPVSVEFYDDNHHRKEGYKSAPSIPAAVAAAREAMGQ